MATTTKRKSWKRWALVASVIVVVACALWYVKLRKDNSTQYTLSLVTRGDLTQLVTAAGQLNPVTNVQVGCQISGTIAKLYADYNSPVTNGQLVAEIDPRIYRANLHSAEGDLANAEAALELATVNERRSKELLVNRLIPQSDYDQAVATLHQAQATVEIKRATVELARANLQYCTIYSPVNGMVISRSVDVGQTVAASFNAPQLFLIANDITKMQIDANVAESDIGGVEKGQKVDFTVDAFPNRTFHGTVVQVRNSPLTVQNVVTYDTVIGVNNDDLKLKPGMTANVSIIVAERKDVLRVPNAALRFHPQDLTNTMSRAASGGPGAAGGSGGGAPGQHPKGEHRQTHTVYVLKNDKPEPVQIKIGITDSINTEVTEGLSESNNVITFATYKQASGPNNPFGMRRF
ncbi:MAG TPA: efflux RND transporter periplasmic adaptor subunit [Verrucomicrobiae bacterium]|nr:efflux RND transporter periplasmic adaptor subunit [Verrucomicrobiae bacterium]